MSLLLDARKKSQQDHSSKGAGVNYSDSEPGLEEQFKTGSATFTPHSSTSSDEVSRGAGKNLFKAKSSAASLTTIGNINRNLLLALGCTFLLLMGGAGYVWYVISDSGSPPPRRLAPIVSTPISPHAAPAADASVPEAILSAKPASTEPAKPAKQVHQTNKSKRKNTSATSQAGTPIRIKPQQKNTAEPLINEAYRAYRNGQLNKARQMYLDVLGSNTRNIDALLGLAAISQQLGEDSFATQYYLRSLALDPRNAVAHAGMSALNLNENSESRLKNLLREQNDSAALHFALGNIYAKQSRWAEAQLAYFNAYTLDAKNAELSLNLAISLDHLGQSKLSAQYYQRALELDQKDSNPHSFDHMQISQRISDLTR